MTCLEAAAALGLDPSHVRRLIREGKLPARKLGRDWWIETQDLDLARTRPTPGYPKGRPRRPILEA